MLKVVDGDTLDLDVDLGMRTHTHERVRLLGLNAPEMNSSNPDERAAAKLATAFLLNLVQSSDLILKTKKDSQEKYGRYLATIINGDGVDVNEELIKAGHAVAYDGTGPMPKWPWK